MILLAIETSTEYVSCAIGGAEGVIASVECGPGLPPAGRQRATPRHAEVLAPAIEFLTTHSRIELGKVGVVAVGLGPGMFTGVRVGVATAKSLAMALGVPMVGIESLDLLAFDRRHSDRRIATIVDARRDEVYVALYQPVPAGVQRLWGPRLCSVSELVAELEADAERVLAVGTGAVRYCEELSRVAEIEVDAAAAFPTASALVTLAHPKAIHEEFVQPVEIEPVYLRPAATPKAGS